ncbi:MAG TPA: superoxide dismutase family protein [Afifellaceae bacterium]|nr:superoxide dismutase family protein [Afifellaceae bacterium]
MRIVSIATFAAAALLAGSAAAQESATANLQDQDGQDVGTVELHQTPNGVHIIANLTNLPAGEHGFHIHETGACEGDFTSAGGHYNPGGAEHGYLAEGGPHAGDMPNIHVAEGGSLTIEVVNDRVSLEEGAEGTLRDDDGSAIVVHANPDDYESQPSGDAGNRIACGVIE